VWLAEKATEATGKEFKQVKMNVYLRKLRKSDIGFMIDVKEEGRFKFYSLFPAYNKILHGDLYCVYSKKYPDTVRDLKRRYPEIFNATKKEEAYQQAKDLINEKEKKEEPFVVDHDYFSKCPECQYKSFDNIEGRCVAVGCGYSPKEEEIIPNKFDALTKEVINKALRDKFGQDINVNVNIHVSFELK